MKKIKVLFLLFTWVVLAFAGACGESDEDTITQAELDAMFADAILAAGNESGGTGTACVTNCAALEAFEVSAIEGTIDCPGGGTVTIEVGTCDANGTIPITATFNNCNDGEGNLLNGTATVSVTVSATSSSVSISSSGLDINGFTFSSSNATVNVPCVNGVTTAPTCSGSIAVDGTSCTLNADCSGCTI